ncbi:MAG: O-antigen ligase family protein [bacterium]
MTKPKLQRALLTIINACAVLAVLTPLVVAYNVYFPFVLPKATAFQIIVQVMVAAWLILAAINKKYRPDWKNPVVRAVAIFILALLITLPFSIDPAQSFWSSTYRMMGVFQYLHFAAWFLVLASVYKSWSGWRALLITSTAAALVVDIIGFVQDGGAYSATRLDSTFGNPLYFAAYILLHIFIALYLWSKERNKSWQYAFLGAAAIHTIALILSASRGSMLALAVTGIALVCGLIWHYTTKRRRTILFIAVAILAIVFIGSFFALRSGRLELWGQENLPTPVSRMIYADLGSDRTEIWNIARSGIEDRPIFGWGLENFAATSNLYIDQAGEHQALTETWYDRVHNQFIELLVLTGVVGFLAFVWMWWQVLRQTIAHYRLAGIKKERIATLILSLLVAAHIIQLQFIFDTSMANMVIFAILAMIASLIASTRPGQSEEKVARPLTAGIVTIIAVAIIIPLQYFTNILPYQKTIQATSGYLSAGSNSEAALADFNDSLDSNSIFNNENRFLMRDAVEARADLQPKSEATQRYLESLATEMEILLSERPYDYRALVQTAEVYRWLASYDDSGLARGTELAMQAIELGPNRPEAYEELAEIAIASGDYEGALSLYIEAGQRSRQLPVISGYLRSRIVVIAAYLGDIEQIPIWIQGAEADGYSIASDPRVALALADAYTEEFDLGLVLYYLEKTWVNYPRHTGLLRARALMYYEAGDKTVTSLTINLLSDVYPALAENLKTELGLE